MNMITQSFLQELEMEMPNTRKSLERIPDKFDWSPHKKSMTVGRLAQHLAEIPDWAVIISRRGLYGYLALLFVSRAGRRSARSAAGCDEQRSGSCDVRQESVCRESRLVGNNRRTPDETVVSEDGRQDSPDVASNRSGSQFRAEPQHSSPRAVGCLLAVERYPRAFRLRSVGG